MGPDMQHYRPYIDGRNSNRTILRLRQTTDLESALAGVARRVQDFSARLGQDHRLDGFPGEEVKAILILVFLAVAGIISLWVASSNTQLSVTPAVNTIGP